MAKRRRGGQFDLFDGEPPKSHHADDLSPEAEQCNQVLDGFRRVAGIAQQHILYGATADELAAATGLTRNQVSGTFGELKKWGRIRMTESKRKSAFGGLQAVYLLIGDSVLGKKKK